MEWSLENTTVTIRNDSGEIVQTVTYDDQTSALRFLVASVEHEARVGSARLGGGARSPTRELDRRGL